MTSPSWLPPTPSGPLDAVVRVPGSKSLTARLLVLAALADGPSVLRNPLRARDTELMAAALRALGHGVDTSGDDWAVTPASTPATGAITVDVGLSGTVTRFLPAVAALTGAGVTFDGDARMRERPIGALLTALRDLGADVDGDALPFTVRGHGRLAGGSVSLDASASSQLVSGLLLAAPRMDGGVEVHHVGEPVPSQPYLDMTVDELRRSGAVVDDAQPDVWRVKPGALHARDAAVEPDLSSAVPFVVAPLVGGGSVTLGGWPERSTQPGAALPELLRRLGGTATVDGRGLSVQGSIQSIDVDLADFSEAAPVLTAAALFADGPTTIRGVAHLRGHETDRLAALSQELGRLGADVRETADGLTIHPVTGLHAATLDPRADHRLAMAYAVAGLRIPGLEILDAATVGKTVPDFADRWTRMVRG